MNFPSGTRLVDTLPLMERRRSQAELAMMPIEDRIIYEAGNPPSEAEKQEELEHEDAMHELELTGELDPRIILANEPPPDWGQ